MREWLRNLFRPEGLVILTPEERRIYTAARAAIGLLAFLLPVVLIAGETWIEGKFTDRDSLSSYYHSGVRDYFVGTMCVIAGLLLVYKFFKPSLDNTLSKVVAVAALGIAFFPTGTDDKNLTKLQIEWGEDEVKAIHTVCTYVFFACLALLSYLFARRERQRLNELKSTSSLFEKRRWLIHVACVVGVAVGGLLIFWNGLWGEIIAMFSFAISFLYKGFDRKVIFNSRPASPPSAS